LWGRAILNQVFLELGFPGIDLTALSDYLELAVPELDGLGERLVSYFDCFHALIIERSRGNHNLIVANHFQRFVLQVKQEDLIEVGIHIDTHGADLLLLLNLNLVIRSMSYNLNGVFEMVYVSPVIPK
jgi:hypothetical protein